MNESKTNQLPSISQLLGLSPYREAIVLCGEKLLDKEISSVISGEGDVNSKGALRIMEAKKAYENGVCAKDISCLMLVATASEFKKIVGFHNNKKIARNLDGTKSSDIGDLLITCEKNKVPVVVVKSAGQFQQTVSQAKDSLIGLIQEKAQKIYREVFEQVLVNDLDGLVGFLFEKLNRPVAIETAEFKLIANKKLKGTPVKEREKLLSKVEQILNDDSGEDNYCKPIRLNSRIVVPLIYSDKGQSAKKLVGFLSLSMKPDEVIDDQLNLLKPACLAATVNIVERRRKDPGLASKNITTLKSLVTGSRLSSVELEKLEIHFGFDVFDAFYIFGVDTIATDPDSDFSTRWPDEIYVSFNVENTRFFIVPFHRRSKQSWKEVSEKLINEIKEKNKHVGIQLGAAPPVETMVDFHKAYKQARQSLIIGAMANPDTEFAIEYGELGLRKLLYLIIDHPEVEQFYKETLGPLEAYDEEMDANLTDTLKVYVDNGANLNSAARELFIHRHTLRYRLEQIEEDILNIDVDSQEVLLNLQVAFLIKQLLSYTSVDRTK